ncbi:MAG: SoxR reducing system RseC family protein [Pseudomonadales bacterium]|nr:SoxR reducing system RseC family protein [Pseudomonadales bacterium]MBO6564509.1 SoxR reducing system RseC family protein [Pseudomonadales bacterium]MBO6596307.1 SoxR reducing system RseC family protein [Pseudomonadales bacterium]MBO6656612.1 SoxR reducing system RseC family protein [Pseudomonadales bacterium]MBO6702918.1 SoxR reducing system RseC family protein [Pseudomonadales bacterium]
MSVIKLERVSSGSSTFHAMDNACEGCIGCGIRPASISLPHVKGEAVFIEMSADKQWRMLFNSWIKPLLMLVTTSLVCSNLSLSPVYESLMLVAAFVIGFFLCRPVDASALRSEEVLLEGPDE